MSFLSRLHAFNVTICDCTASQQKGFLKFTTNDCDFQISPLPPVPVYYDVFSTLPQITRFVGHTCTMWVEQRTIYTDFWGWQTTDSKRVPMETTTVDCENMRDLRLCESNTMDYLGDNKWSLERVPNVQGKWLLVTGDQLVNCKLEEVTLETECNNCTISSPIGDIPGGTNGSISHNLVTIIWKESLREIQGCKVRLVEQGIANRFMTNTTGVERIRDVAQQLDFVYNTTSKQCCNSSELSFKPVLGMDKVVLKIYPLTDHNTHPNKSLTEGDEKVADTIRASISGAAHAQYTSDRTIEGINGVSRELRALQCENRELAHKNAITAAQHSAWLAASYLSLPLCSKLIATGESISIHQCSPTNATFSTEFTSCGPQPRYGNFTIDIEGWELTSYNPCYWHKNYVNFNGRAHYYKNSSWVAVIPGIIVQGNNLIDTLPYEVDNALGLSLHPMLTAHPMSPSAAIAQILAAARVEHSINLGSPFHLDSVLSSTKKKEVSFMAKISSWLSTICSLFGFGFVGFLIFRFCGVGSLIARYIPCCSCLSSCNPFGCLTKKSPDIELGHPNFPNSPNMASPITIVNVPSPSQRPTPEFIVPSAPYLGTLREGRIRPDDLRRAHREAAALLN